MPVLRELTYREITSRLRKLGFRFYRKGRGSHELWVRDSDSRVVSVPHYRGKRIRKGTLAAIIREVGSIIEEFFDL